MTPTPTKPSTTKRLLFAVATLTILVVTASVVAAQQPAADYDAAGDLQVTLDDIDSRLDSIELSAESRYGHIVRTRELANIANTDIRFLEADLDALVARVDELEHDRAAMRSELTPAENMACVQEAELAKPIILVTLYPDGPNDQPTLLWREYNTFWIDCGPYLRYRTRNTGPSTSGWCTHSLHDPVTAELFERHPFVDDTSDSCVHIHNGALHGYVLWHTDDGGWYRHNERSHGDLPVLL